MPFNFSWLIEGRVAGMAHPPPGADGWLAEQGVTAVVSLTTRPPEAIEGFELLHAPVTDMTAPSLDLLMRTVGFIQEELGKKGAVAVHCTAGMGRTGTVLAAFLVAGGLGADEAIQAVRLRRPGSIETRSQELVIHKFAELMGAQSA